MTQFNDSGITITIQAASDAVMTQDNETSGTALADDDTRKMYGLPHTYSANRILYDNGELGLGIWQTLKNVAPDWMAEPDYTTTRDVKTHDAVVQLITNDSWSMLSGTLNKDGTEMAKSLRWDTVHAFGHKQLNSVASGNLHRDFSRCEWITSGYGPGDVSVTQLRGNESDSDPLGLVDRRPTTTAFALRCNSIQQAVNDQSSVTPLMGIDWGESGKSGQPEQLDNFSFNPGFKRESIKLSGVLIDNGPITPNNPRRQNLLTIARTQYLKIRNAPPIPDSEAEGTLGKIQGAMNKWGGLFAGPTNPRSYPCLTIFNRGYDSYDAGDDTDVSGGVGKEGWTEPDGAYRIYRGIIKNLSFTMESGRPDYWQWSMDFEIISNEKRSISGLYDAQQAEGEAKADSGNKAPPPNVIE